MLTKFKSLEAIAGFIQFMRHFSGDIKKQRGVLIVAFLGLWAEVFLSILEPWPLKFIFDAVIPVSDHQSNSQGLKFFNSMSPDMFLIFSVVLLVVIAALRAVADYVSTIGFAIAGNKITTTIRTKLYQHIQRLGLAFHSKSRNGDLLIRMIGDISLLQEISVTAILPLLANSLVLIGMLGVMVWMNWQLGLVALSIIPLFWLTTYKISGRLSEVSKKQRRIQGNMAATAAESVSAIKTVQALSLESIFAEKFGGTSDNEFKQGVKAKRLSARLERTVDFLIAINTALVLYFGTKVVMSKSITPGDLLVFIAYLKNAYKPIRNFAKYLGRISKASAAGERVLSIFDIEPDIKNSPDACVAPVFSGQIEFRDVSFYYNQKQPVLKGINFTIKPGQRVAIIAPSGSGKSTLVNLMLRLYDPQEGQVLIDGIDIRKYTIDSLRSQFSVVLQDNILFASNVYDNISYGASNVTPEMIKQAAILANADGFIESLPEGYDTVLGERGCTLSNGQRQRIAIARAAVRRSAILILDEPTAGLDKENEREVIKALQQVSQNRTSILITHDLSLVVDYDLILYLHVGHITEQGKHHELLDINRDYARLFDMQSK